MNFEVVKEILEWEWRGVLDVKYDFVQDDERVAGRFYGVGTVLIVRVAFRILWRGQDTASGGVISAAGTYVFSDSVIMESGYLGCGFPVS